MNLINYNWKDRYTTVDNIIDSFYNPALERSRFYYRIAGYFSSSSIAVASNGFSNFVENGEKIFMIIGGSITESDVAAIKSGSRSKEDLLREKWDDCLKELEDDSWAKGRFKALAWLLAHDKLEIKIGVNMTPEGEIIPLERSYFHEKIIIFEDYEGNKLHTEGSINETARGWQENRESFSVHRSWIDGQRGHVESAKREFEKLWQNEDTFSRVIDIPDALRKEIISYADPEPPPRECYRSCAFSKDRKDIIKLRRYQKEAIEAWKNAGKSGILEMATGTGKTITGLFAIKSDFDDGNLLVIVVPQKELVSQWVDQCMNILDNPNIIECHSGTPWKDSLRKFINISSNKPSVIIALKNTFTSDLFQKILERRLSNTILLFDEVHEMGSSKAKEVFKKLDRSPFRLGLSATPDRWDEAGNINIRLFFKHDKPVYTFNLSDAIKPKEGYEKSLCDYNYYVDNCSLNEEELYEYREFTQKIQKEILRKKDDQSFASFYAGNKRLQALVHRRANITKGCKSRLYLLYDIVEKFSYKLNKCIVYCNTVDEINTVTSNLMKMGHNAVEYHSRLPKQQRENNLESFKYGLAKFIVAVKCLDQGIDIPMCDSAIITSSSQNPREYIQRRGRILRLYGKDKIAEIFDIIVLPYSRDDLERDRVYMDQISSEIVSKQLNRVKLFTESAKNMHECHLEIIKLEKLVNKHGSLD